MTILNGRVIADKIYSDLKRRLRKLKNPLGLGIILVGNNPASLKYVSLKTKRCQALRVFYKKIHLNSKASEREIIKKISYLNNNAKIDGIIVQLPLPNKLNSMRILSHIKENKDIEGLNPANFNKIIRGENGLTVVPAAIMKMIDFYHIKLRGQFIVIINDNYLIGRPLAYLLLNQQATVALCNRWTKLIKLTKQADIIISAVGKPKLINSSMIKKGAIIFDLGFSFINNTIVGDVDFNSVKKKCRLITPASGGIGPIAVALIFLNAYKLKINNFNEANKNIESTRS